jgi:hypothetical protein
MSSRRLTPAQLVGLCAVLLVAAGCGNSSATWPGLIQRTASPSGTASATGTASASGTDKAVAVATAGRTAAPQATGARATAAPVTIGKITADFSYKNALITPIAHLYGTYLDDFVIVTVKNDNSQAVKVVVTSEILNFTNKAIDTVTVGAHKTAVVRQNPQLTTAAIDELDSERPAATLHMLVTYLDNGVQKTLLDQTKQTLITSRRDFPWSIKDMDQQMDFNLIGAMVTPSDPAVEGLIRAAANYDPSHSMESGYKSDLDKDGSVYQRLADLWKAEADDYNLTYISTTISFAPGQSQRIRLPAEVLDQASGNCIELVLLYAAAVEALAMQPVIVLIPGHAYLGVRTDATNDRYYFVETTMIGQATFDEASSYAGNEFDDAQPHLSAGDADYGWVSIADDRANGILPIPWR